MWYELTLRFRSRGGDTLYWRSVKTMSTDKDDLEPLDPETGVKLFLEHKATDCTESTVRNHRYRMKKFLNWCDAEDIDNLNDLSGRDVQRFRLWIDDDDVNALIIKNLMSCFRVFLKWAGSVEAVPESLYSKLMIPRVRRSEQSSEKILETERAEEILEYLSRYEYASIHHVLLALLWETGIRMGAVLSLDLVDVDFEQECVELVRHVFIVRNIRNRCLVRHARIHRLDLDTVNQKPTHGAHDPIEAHGVVVGGVLTPVLELSQLTTSDIVHVLNPIFLGPLDEEFNDVFDGLSSRVPGVLPLIQIRRFDLLRSDWFQRMFSHRSGAPAY